MTRKCSHCSKIGHNSRTCSGFRSGNTPETTTTPCGSVRLFGVRIGTSHSSSSTSLAAISKCLSLDCTSHSSASASASAASSSPSTSSPSRFVVEENPPDVGAPVNDFLSYGILPGSPDKIRKGVPWLEDEHKQFLMGLEKLGKGDWRGISKHFVHTRTPTQVASHAQKYFLRRASVDIKKRRSSLFDVGGNNNDRSPMRHNPIPTDQQLSRRRPSLAVNQQLVDAPRPFDLSLGLSANNANQSSVPSSSSSCPKQTTIDLDLTLAAPWQTLPSSLSPFGTMRVT